MRRRFAGILFVLALVLALGLVIPLTGCGVLGIGGQTAMTTAGPGRIDADNIPGGGVTGGTDHGFCDPGEPDEWHFVINNLDPQDAAPVYMTAVFAVEGEVHIPREKVTPGGVAHYTLAGYLGATLVGAYADLGQPVTYNRFNLSHAPCGEAPPVEYNLTVSSTDGGSVTSPGEGSFTYDAGTVVTLTANPASGYEFDHWSGTDNSAINPTTVTMNSNKSVTAYFTKVQYTLTTSVSPSGSGSVDPSGGTFDAGTVVTLTANPASGYEFDHWSGTDNSAINPTTLTMNSNKSVTAYFTEEITYYTLTMHASPSGGGTTTPSVGNHSYATGTVVSLSASPASGYRFSHWSGDASGTSLSTTITMNSNKDVTANFGLIPTDQTVRYGLTLAVSPGVGGTATDETGAASYEEGDIVAIKALATDCYDFVSWTAPAGAFADAYATETAFTMPGRDVTVTADFEFAGNPIRALPDQVLPGEKFDVTVTFAAPYDGFHAIALTDVAPVGWDVTVNALRADPEATAVHTPAAETAAYVWYGPYDFCVPFTTVYKVRVPPNTEPGTYTFSGSLKYYIEPHPAPPYEQEVTGDIEVRVEEGETVTIAGVTKEVDGAILPGAAVVLYQNDEPIGNVVSDESGKYGFEFSELGDYEVMVSKAGFRGEAQSISVTTLAVYYPDFVGDHGLIPDAPSMSYVLACISLWKFGEPPLQLSTSRILDVTSAWIYPIT